MPSALDDLLNLFDQIQGNRPRSWIGDLGRIVRRYGTPPRRRDPSRVPPSLPNEPPPPSPGVPPVSLPSDSDSTPPPTPEPPSLPTVPDITQPPPPNISGIGQPVYTDLDNDDSIVTVASGLGSGSGIFSGGRLSEGVPVSIARLIGRIADIGSIASGISDVFAAPALPPLNRGPAMPGPFQTLPKPGVPSFTSGGSLTSYTPGRAPACGVAGYHYAKDGSGRLVKNRRMNPLNPKAARRAIRRIKAARKMLTSIERSLPTRTVRRRS